MASIFTFESEPPRVSSPWPAPPNGVASSGHENGTRILAGMEMPHAEVLTSCGISKLEAEPQEGPIEYKLHLLLRPRRSFSSISTVQKVSGSHVSKTYVPRAQSEPDLKPVNATALWAPSSQSKQNRLQHLTTQLLWRLQQSSPFHSSSKSSLVIPVLPEADVERAASNGPGPLISGLEESAGALYEIGVSDDGVFVGLAIDELEESLIVLQAMAFSIGCDLKILRMMIVGDCQWIDQVHEESKLVSSTRKEKLWVAEVLVAPHLGSHNVAPDVSSLAFDSSNSMSLINEDRVHTEQVKCEDEQLRISLTGSTTSGKSSLLGTLSTSTLDNGRGKSRLSLLKHRHEIVSGVTSSLAQELFGYQDGIHCTKVVNYSSGNVSSWDDIHHASENGRLVFVTDSAGHPRYRRTTVRGLVSWAPHWTLCCIAADDDDCDSSGKIGATASSSEILGTAAGVNVDLSKAHLELCLKLQVPLVIVITKLDLATKSGLRNTLTKILTALKAAGRKPTILSSPSNDSSNPQLGSIAKSDEEIVRTAISSVETNKLSSLVPVVFTSAITGSGIGRLHALLRQLPMGLSERNTPDAMIHQAEVPRTLFHVDEVFAMPSKSDTPDDEKASRIILSGYLRYGTLKVGSHLMIGPCAPDLEDTKVSSRDVQHPSSYPVSAKENFRIDIQPRDLQRSSSGDLANQDPEHEEPMTNAHTWQEVQVTSLRNLRLPVRALSAGQVGTVAVMLPNSDSQASLKPATTRSSIRRGMVIISPSRDPQTTNLPSHQRFSAVFQEAGLPAWPGILVIVYIASIRASAKIVNVKALEAPSPEDEVFKIDDVDLDDSDDADVPESPVDTQRTEITFEFASSPEWIEPGTQVLVTPGGSPSLTGQPEQRDISSAGLDGYVGKITQVFA